MGARRKARELALQMLYQFDLSGNGPDTIIETFEDLQKSKPNTREFATKIFRGTVSYIEDIDGMIQAQADNWRLSRMAVVDPDRPTRKTNFSQIARVMSGLISASIPPRLHASSNAAARSDAGGAACAGVALLARERARAAERDRAERAALPSGGVRVERAHRHAGAVRRSECPALPGHARRDPARRGPCHAGSSRRQPFGSGAAAGDLALPPPAPARGGCEPRRHRC